MKQRSRFFGSLLLIIGTSIGAGLLALPVVTANCGFLATVCLLVGCWFVMTAGALFILEVNLRLPKNANMVTMAGRTLGAWGSIVTWVVYLCLLYALLAAYLAGGTDVAHFLLHFTGLGLPAWFDTLAFLVILGLIVFFGLTVVDRTNRVLMTLKFISFLGLIIILSVHVKPDHLMHAHFSHLPSAVMVVITSFGFAIVVPSLRVYLDSDPRALRLAIIIGSLTALACYLVWLVAIQGSLPFAGQTGLDAVSKNPQTVTALTESIHSNFQVSLAGPMMHFFASVCILTSFLGVSLSLSDFLADGLGLKKEGINQCWIYGLTFVPPLLVVLFLPGMFIKALSVAGVLCVLLLIMLPTLMAYRARRIHLGQTALKVAGGYPFIGFILIISIGLLFFA
jgi:tyrosine-specific transport protein